MSKVIRFSVIMNVRNSGEFLKAALDSVYRQTETSWEIILFDNGSTDNTPEIVKSYDSRLVYVRGEGGLSLGEARNQAMARATGEYITFLDGDDVWESDKLQWQHEVFSRHPEVGFIYSQYRDWFQENGRKQSAVHNRELIFGDLFPLELERYQVGILTVAFRSALLKDVEWFDTRLNLTEDYDFFLRLMSKTKAYYSPQSSGDYRVHGSNLSSVLKKDRGKEVALVLKKLENAVPDFRKKFSKEIRTLEAKIAYLEARVKISEGRAMEARALLVPFRFDSFLFFGLYCLSFAPFLWLGAYRVYRFLRYRLS